MPIQSLLGLFLFIFHTFYALLRSGKITQANFESVTAMPRLSVRTLKWFCLLTFVAFYTQMVSNQGRMTGSFNVTGIKLQEQET